MSARYTSVWVKKGGAWVMTAQQATQETPAEAGGGRAKVPDWQKLTPEQLRRLGEKGEELSKKQAREGFLSEMWMALLGAAVAVVVLIGGIWWRMGGQATAKSAGPSTEDEAKAAAYFDALDRRDRKAGQ